MMSRHLCERGEVKGDRQKRVTRKMTTKRHKVTRRNSHLSPSLFVAHCSGTLTGGGGRNGREEGFHTAMRGTLFVCNGAVTPGQSREFDITFVVKGRPRSTQKLRDSTVVARRVQSVTVPSSRMTHECRSPRVKVSPRLSGKKEAHKCLTYRLSEKAANPWTTSQLTRRCFYCFYFSWVRR